MTKSPSPAPDAVRLDLTGRTALVTGAGSGIGRATALRLARAGAHVRCWDITPGPVEEVAGFLRSRGISATAYSGRTDDAERLSYPDWMVDRFVHELGETEGHAALECMNEPPQVSTRDDGYIQDRGSQWVADLVEATEAPR